MPPYYSKLGAEVNLSCSLLPPALESPPEIKYTLLCDADTFHEGEGCWEHVAGKVYLSGVLTKAEH